MAYVHIHGIKTTLNKALEYIENPDKTDDQLLVSGYNVDPLMASVEFGMTAALAREVKGDYRKTGGADNLAYHMYQSFSPYDKITPQEAHELGKKWADEVLEGKYEYVISTHIDKGHIHNHIIFNATSFYDYGKYNNYKVAAHLREVSDRLCAERGLYVIKNPRTGKGKTHYEWEHWKNGTSWKAQIGRAIDEAIAKATDYESFRAALLEAGVEIKEGQRISFRMRGQERFSRGDRIGDDYTRERILERLSEPKKERARRMPYDDQIERRAQKSKLAATKELAEALVAIRREAVEGPGDFEDKIAALQARTIEVQSMLQEVDTKNKQYADAAKYLLTYREYLPIVQAASQQTKFTRAKYEARYQGELTAFGHAVKQLEKIGVNTNVDPDKVLELVKQRTTAATDLRDKLESINSQINDLRKAQEIVERLRNSGGQDKRKEPTRGEVR